MHLTASGMNEKDAATAAKQSVLILWDTLTLRKFLSLYTFLLSLLDTKKYVHTFRLFYDFCVLVLPKPDSQFMRHPSVQ